MCMSHLRHAWPERHCLWLTAPASALAISAATALSGVTLDPMIMEGLALLCSPGEPDGFRSARWGSGKNPDLAFAGSAENRLYPTRRVLEGFPGSRRRPSLITPVPHVAPTSSKPVRRWNLWRLTGISLNCLLPTNLKLLGPYHHWKT